MMELCWGDVGLALTVPRQGLGNAALSAVGTDEQKAQFGKRWIAMAITEPGAGSDSAAIRTTARLDGDEWVLNGEKIFVTAGDRADALVVWATLDPSLGRAAIKSFLVPRGRARSQARTGSITSSASARRTRRRSSSTTAAFRRTTSSAARTSTRASRSPAR